MVRSRKTHGHCWPILLALPWDTLLIRHNFDYHIVLYQKQVVSTNINRPVREGDPLTVQVEDHSKLRFPWYVILPFPIYCKCILVSKNGQQYLDVQPLLSKIQPYRWKEYLQSMESAVLNGSRTGQLENVFSNWMYVKRTSFWKGQLMLFGTGLWDVLNNNVYRYLFVFSRKENVKNT